ncbi:hypothetical protein ACAW74_18205 [Fibrella sp. WM1]|uniref:hypothetical protein n=1 Tax=Fibrella musci TaxID=3242485 RepID=UPI003521DB1E
MIEKGQFNIGLTVSIVVGLLIAYVLISLLHSARNRPAPAPAPAPAASKKQPIGFDQTAAAADADPADESGEND